MADVIENNIEYRYCSRCRRKFELNKENFHQNKHKPKGFSRECKSCVKSRSKKYFDSLTQPERKVKNIKTQQWRKAQYEKGLCKFCNNTAIYGKVCKKHYLENLSQANLGTTKYAVELEKLLEKQNYKCVYSGVTLILGENAGIDHIKPVAKYPELKDDILNVQWVDKIVNRIKYSFSEEEFLNLVAKVYEYKIRKE